MYPFDPRPWPFPSHITGSFAIQSLPSKTWSRSEGPQLWFCNVKGWTGCQLIPNKESRSIIWLWCSTCAQLLQVHSCIWLYQNHWPQRSDGVGWVLHDLRFRGQHWNFPESSAKLAVLCPAWHVRPETLVIQLTWDVVGQNAGESFKLCQSRVWCNITHRFHFAGIKLQRPQDHTSCFFSYPVRIIRILKLLIDTAADGLSQQFLKGHEEVSKDYKARSSDTNLVKKIRWKCKKLRWKCDLWISIISCVCIVVLWIFFAFCVLILPRWCNGWPAKAVSQCQCYVLSWAIYFVHMDTYWYGIFRTFSIHMLRM